MRCAARSAIWARRRAGCTARNTVGSLLGALVGGYLLLIWLDLHHVYRIAVAAIALAATIVTLHLVPRIRFAGAAALLIVAFVALGEFPAWRANYLMAGTFRSRQPENWTFAGPSVLGQRRADFSFHDDDPNTSVGILDSNGPEGLTRSILVNGKSDGNSSGDLTTTVLLALVPAMFADPPANVFQIGFGTGVSAGTLAQLPEVQSVTIAEISSGVIKASPLFDFADHGVSTHPKVHFVHSDAYRALLKGHRSYDVILLGAEQSLGDRCRAALLEGVPERGAQPAHAARRVLPVVPPLRSEQTKRLRWC
jgi:hypothetical protein